MPMSPDWWLQVGTSSTAEGPAMQGQANQIRALELAPSSVVSEDASANLLTKSVTLPLIGRTASSSGGYSSTYTVWRPFIPARIVRVALYNTEDWVLTTDSDFTAFRNSSSCVAGVTITSTTLAAGTRTAISTINNALIAAGQDVTFKFGFSTCAEPSRPRGYLQLDYQTTD